MYGIDQCDLRINKFYKAPIGDENWAIKHIKLRSSSTMGTTQRQQEEQKRRLSLMNRLPVMKPLVKPANPRYVTKVMRNHYRTQDLLADSSRRAGKEVVLSRDTVRRA